MKEQSSTNRLESQYGPFLSIADVMEIFGVCRATVEKLIYQENLPFVKIGRSYRVKTSDFEMWYEERKRYYREQLMKGLF